nr:PREDICTED: probable polyamine transporter At3g13620 [Daucus carota subsp. sativus]
MATADATTLAIEAEPQQNRVKSPDNTKKLKLIPLVFLVYFDVAGGPYGEEPAVQGAGPLLAILGFLIFPFIWSIPEALITAELSTAFPGNGGFVIWAHHAFGPFFGSMMGSLKFLSTVINIASFPVQCIDYLKRLFHIFSDGQPRTIAISVSTLMFCFLNLSGLTIVGYVAVALGVISLLPFFIMSAIAIPSIHPKKWLSTGQNGVKKNWNLFFNTLFWNLNYWDNVSTMAGEVDNPQKQFPVALLSAVTVTCLGYIIPLMAVTGAVNADQTEWEVGYMANAARTISGQWLKYWIEVGAILAGIGAFEAQLSSCSYQLLGMAELGILPKFFGLRLKYVGTPWVGILLSTVISFGVSHLDFTVIIGAANFLYSLGMLLEFSAFIWLRWKFPALARPYRVPMRLPALVIMCLVSSGFLVVIMVIATNIVHLISGLMIAGAIGWYFLMKYCKSKKWLEFNNGNQDKVDVL